MTDSIAPPYPADTRAKGWRFELDYEKIDQSDTWGLAAEVPLARPCLVMMWLVAWTQEPCGSLPNDEAIIRARCGIPANVWPKVRGLLMRGWWAASDGRLYHDTVAQRVLEMIEYRRKNAERVAAFKAAKREQQAGNALPPSDSHDKNDTGTGTGTGTNSSTPPVKKKRPAAPSAPCPPDVDAKVWSDWCELRNGFKAKVSDTAVQGARDEAQKAGMSLEAFLRIWCTRGIRGLQADWIKPNERQQASAATETAYARSMREKYENVTPMVAAAKPGAVRNLNPMEVLDGLTRISG